LVILFRADLSRIRVKVMMTSSPAARFTYLGPEGTFTEAALRTLPEAATRELVPMVSVPATLDAVRSEEAAAALVPIENSVEGGITSTLDELATGTPLMIFREVLLPIAFALLVRPGTDLASVKTVTGHPVAQPQVRNWIAANLPDAVWEPAASNADGARLVQEGRFDAAFAGEFAAPRYGLEPLVTGIHDAESAHTRFVLAGRPGRPPARTGADKTSAVFWLRDDHPGALLELLQEFAVRGVNLVRIESRPTGEGIGRYCFSVDCEGHIGDRRVGEALMGLKRICPQVRFLGSYPRADEAVPQLRPGTTDTEFTEAADWLSRALDGRL
jgi:prephenate dehydratase